MRGFPRASSSHPGLEFLAASGPPPAGRFFLPTVVYPTAIALLSATATTIDPKRAADPHMPPAQATFRTYETSTLDVRGLACVRGGRTVFTGLSFSLGAGGALRLLGPNGSGKSSLLRTLAGLIPPAAGEITWNGEPVAADLDAHQARLLYAGHLDAVKPWLTVAENVAFWAELFGVGGDVRNGVADALKSVALEHAADLPARLLSAGQRHRLALARLAILPAPLWLLDEPTAALDAESVARVEDLIAGHCGRGGIAIVATHGDLALPGTAELGLEGGAARTRAGATG